MKRPVHLATLSFAAVILLVVWGRVPVCAQDQAVSDKNQLAMDYLNEPVLEDWSTRHVVFSNPGTLEDARRNGREAEWWRVVTDPRYRMQWVKEYGASLRAAAGTDPSSAPGVAQENWIDDEGRGRGHDKLHGDWSVTLGASGAGVPVDQYPAKFTFFPLAAPSCTNDFVVYPIANSTSTGANILGVNNLYSGTCTTGIVPTVLFAYNVGTGSAQTSPVISLDGTKVAFVESLSTGSYLHILTIDKSGNSGCATPISSSTTPCNGTAYNAAVPACTVNTTTTAGANGPSSTTTTKPCSYNAAVDNRILIYANGNGGPTITRSSPYVDYTNDIAYLGDDNGNLHKFTPFFKATAPVEITTSGSWPACSGSFFLNYCAAGAYLGSPGGFMLASPVFDSTSGLVLVGNSNGTLFADPYTLGGNSSYNFVGKGQTPSSSTNIQDAPIVDSSAEKVYVTTSNGSNMSLLQYGVAAGSSPGTSSSGFVSGSGVSATIGKNGTDAYSGALDHAYLSSATPTSPTGNMYVCGNLSGAATPQLYRVPITSGTMSSTATAVFQLVPSSNTGTSYDCTPLTEFYNSAQRVDYLFVGVKNKGGPSGCGGTTCVMSFMLPTAAPFTFPTGVFAATSVLASTTLTSNGVSGFIIDNASSAAGASQIYFADPFAGTGVQVSQAALH